MNEYHVNDLFETDSLELPEQLAMAPIQKKEVKTSTSSTTSLEEQLQESVEQQVKVRDSINSTTIAKVPEPGDPAFTVVTTGSLSEDEYKIFHASIEEMDRLISISTGEVESGLRKSKLRLLDILAMKFGFPNASTLSKDGLSFNLKKNYEVELIKKRPSRG